VIGILLETPNSAARKKPKPLMPALDSAGDVPTPTPASQRRARRGLRTRRLSFPRSSKLLKHADFQRVYKTGRRHFSGLLTAFYLPRPIAPGNAGRGPRIGTTVGRVLGGAVDRNRIKRKMREAIRQHLAELPFAVDVVINPKKNVLKAEFVDIDQEVARAFQVIRKYMESAAAQASPAADKS
jgi:ribonuclease P protein component